MSPASAHITDYDVVIAGGGLAGLATSIGLSKAGHKVALVEKYTYPFHRVCGEYISEESRPFLESLGIPFHKLQLPRINKLIVSSPGGSVVRSPLIPGGFGISRFRLDALLANIAKENGVHLFEGTKVIDMVYHDGKMKCFLQGRILESKLAIGCFGKRSNVDVKWKRPFITHRPGKLDNYIAVKYHLRGVDLDEDTIALHNFSNGYCGVSRIEDGLYCMCYLTTAGNLRSNDNSILQMENRLLRKNPHIDRLLDRAEIIWDEPLSISQVSFSAKSQVHDHVLLAGDAAGMITPLCGNGMSMALHAGKLLCHEADAFLRGEISRDELEHNYCRQWNRHFAKRLRAGRVIQYFFGDPKLTGLLVGIAARIPGVTGFLIRQTHGEKY
ncbi:NAD(P)/FAD-dependent oxidoreductase [Flavihumibacter solisilvae]|uniref:Pyridine nucleotide-disulfide oxidoreductase n=1 Tax=Flavihumibacter solisilvae TaxID=1349421 RepID=A0A0C1KYL6_9BACT|nr:NAD(P)/FAD-dependent oxidoreductase [Flavihumibacter solisilvae]KIC92817.1 pyridine nucleotide-disulfide oxidoreductase [Flavihumibacter solisilvae]